MRAHSNNCVRYGPQCQPSDAAAAAASVTMTTAQRRPVPPSTAGVVSGGVVAGYRDRQSACAGVTLFLVGLVAILVNGLSLAVGETYAVVGHGFWCGATFVITGVIGISASANMTVCTIVTFMVFCILSSFQCVFLVSIGAIGAFFCDSFLLCNSTVQWRMTLDCWIIGVGALALCISIWGSAICCRAICCSSRTATAPSDLDEHSHLNLQQTARICTIPQCNAFVSDRSIFGVTDQPATGLYPQLVHNTFENIAVVAEPPQPPSYAAVALSSYAPPMSLRPPPPAYGSLEGSPPEPNVWRRGAADNVCLTPSAPSYCSSSDDETDICCDAATEAQTPSSCSFPTSSSTAETREEQLASPAMLPLQMYFY